MVAEGLRGLAVPAFILGQTETLFPIEVQMRLDVCVVFLLLSCSLHRLNCSLPSFTPEMPQHQVGEVHAGRTCDQYIITREQLMSFPV